MGRLGEDYKNEALGQLAWMVPPMSLFEDEHDAPVSVELGAVHYLPDKYTDTPRAREDLHWLIRWYLGDVRGTPYFRVIEIRVEFQDSVSKQTMGTYPRVYTNWGPKTRSITEGTRKNTLWVNIGTLPLSYRKVLEEIASAERVKSPGPREQWNCQDWVKSVLNKAVAKRIFHGEVVQRAYMKLEGYETLKAWVNEQLMKEQGRIH